jgi:hypothetical protein
MPKPFIFEAFGLVSTSPIHTCRICVKILATNFSCPSVSASQRTTATMWQGPWWSLQSGPCNTLSRGYAEQSQSAASSLFLSLRHGQVCLSTLLYRHRACLQLPGSGHSSGPAQGPQQAEVPAPEKLVACGHPRRGTAGLWRQQQHGGEDPDHAGGMGERPGSPKRPRWHST